MGKRIQREEKEENFNKNEGQKFLVVLSKFEPETAASSMCRFGGGEKEWEWLKEFRRKKFPEIYADEMEDK